MFIEFNQNNDESRSFLCDALNETKINKLLDRFEKCEGSFLQVLELFTDKMSSNVDKWIKMPCFCMIYYFSIISKNPRRHFVPVDASKSCSQIHVFQKKLQVTQK